MQDSVGEKDNGDVTMMRAVRKTVALAHRPRSYGGFHAETRADFMLKHVPDRYFSGLPHTHSSSKEVKDYTSLVSPLVGFLRFTNANG